MVEQLQVEDEADYEDEILRATKNKNPLIRNYPLHHFYITCIYIYMYHVMEWLYKNFHRPLHDHSMIYCDILRMDTNPLYCPI